MAQTPAPGSPLWFRILIIAALLLAVLVGVGWFANPAPRAEQANGV